MGLTDNFGNGLMSHDVSVGCTTTATVKSTSLWHLGMLCTVAQTLSSITVYFNVKARLSPKKQSYRENEWSKKMRQYLSLIAVLAVLLLGVLQVSAQETASAAQTAENLRAQLRDVQMREGEIQYRLTQLDYELKPENIERHFAGVGSTRPEELREQRRRQLQIEKDTLTNQLRSLGDSKIRLEQAITRADSLAYQQSALGSMSLMVTRTWNGHKAIVVLAGAVMLFGVVGLVFLARIARRRRQ